MPLARLQKVTYHPHGSYRPSRLQPTRRPVRKRTGHPWLVRLIPLGLLLMASGAITAFGVVAWYARDLPDPSNLAQRPVAQSTKFYDRTGQTLLYELSGEQKSTSIKLSDLPAYVKEATIVAEDRDFYSHRGFVLKGIARAILVDILRR